MAGKREKEHSPMVMLDMAFWQAHIEVDNGNTWTVNELLTLQDRMAPLIEDALNFYMIHGEAPLLEKPKEVR